MSDPIRPRRRTTGPASARLRLFYPPGTGADGLEVHGCGVREWMPEGVYGVPHGRDDWLVMAFQTDCEVEVDGVRVPAPAGSGIIWRPWAPTIYGADRACWCHSWLHLDGAEARSQLEGAGVPLDRPIPGFDPRWLDRCILGLHDEVRAHAAPDGAILRAHLAILLRRVARAARATGGRGAPAELLELRSHLDATYARRHVLRDLARRAGCSVPHLCNRFRRHFGHSPIDYVIQLRLSHAQHLLRAGDRGVAEVARAVGYADYHHFSKLFHARFGRWPSEVRGG